MRKSDEVYWTVSLPKDHEALQALDAYCKEWGGLSRAEATRRLLMEWCKIQRGQPVSLWVPSGPSQPGEVAVPERAQRTPETVNKSVIASRTAKAANQALDD